MPKADSGASALASLLDGSTAGELIPELASHGLRQRIELVVTSILGTHRHERTEKRPSLVNGYQARTLTTRVGIVIMEVYIARTSNTPLTCAEP